MRILHRKLQRHLSPTPGNGVSSSVTHLITGSPQGGLTPSTSPNRLTAHGGLTPSASPNRLTAQGGLTPSASPNRLTAQFDLQEANGTGSKHCCIDFKCWKAEAPPRARILCGSTEHTHHRWSHTQAQLSPAPAQLTQHSSSPIWSLHTGLRAAHHHSAGERLSHHTSPSTHPAACCLALHGTCGRLEPTALWLRGHHSATHIFPSPTSLKFCHQPNQPRLQKHHTRGRPPISARLPRC